MQMNYFVSLNESKTNKDHQQHYEKEKSINKPGQKEDDCFMNLSLFIPKTLPDVCLSKNK